MSRDQAIGILLLVVSIVVILAYCWLLFKPPAWTVLGMSIDLFLIKITAAIAVIGVFAILGWIGYTLATTPPPKPIEEIEKEIEEEIKRLEREIKEEETKGKNEEEKK